MDKATIMDLARLACEQGASIDVAYELEGVVRVSLYPQTVEDRMAKVLEFPTVLSREQYDRLRERIQADMRDTRLRQG